MRSPLAQAIRNARRSCALTQRQLAARLEVIPRSVVRWENDKGAPTRKHRRALLRIIGEVNKPAADRLSEILENGGEPPQLAASAPVRPPVDPWVQLEHRVFAMADELDLPARRVRGSLVRLLRGLGSSGLTLESMLGQMEAWNARAP